MISGVPLDGQTLTAGSGTWAGTGPFSYSYQWFSCAVLTGECSAIAGATESTYTAQPLDVGNEFEVTVTATGAHGSAGATSAKSGVVSALIPSNTGLPSISGILEDGQQLVAAVGEWLGGRRRSRTNCNGSCAMPRAKRAKTSRALQDRPSASSRLSWARRCACSRPRATPGA